jgi:hypothetical protein
MNLAHAPTTYPIEPARPWCPSCGYDLRASVTISGARCPECGAALPFDGLRFPGDKSPARRAVKRRMRRIRVRAPSPRWLLLVPVVPPAALAIALTNRWTPLVFLAVTLATILLTGALTRRPRAADST